MLTLQILFWITLGAIGCVLGTLRDLRRGDDFTVSDLIVCVFGSLGGVITLAIGAVSLFDQLRNENKNVFTKTLIKGNRK